MKHFVLVLTLLFVGYSWSQDLPFVVNGKVENFDVGKKEGGVTVSVVQNGSTVSSAQTASNGKYTLKANVNLKQPYQVVFSKNGFVSKRVNFDFSKMNDEDTPASSEFRPVESLDMSIFKDRDNIDFSFLDSEPVAKFDWNDKQLSPRLDRVAAGKMRTKIEELLNKAEKDKAEADAKYQAAIIEADQFYDKKEYESAIEKYEEALSYKPAEKYPADRILELDALLQAQQEADLKQEQADAAYNNLISAADNLRDQGQLEKAISTYKEALKEKDEQYPKDQISAIQAQIDAKKQEEENQAKYDEAIKMGDVFFNQNSLKAAKDKFTEATNLKPSESYPKEKLKEIEGKMKELEEKEALKKQYDDAIAAGDAAFDSEDYETAKTKYQEALAIESSSTYAKGRIALCDEKLKAAQDAADKEAKIAELLKKGQDEFSQDKLEDAKSTYNEVLGIDAENAEATAKIAEIDQKLQQQADAQKQEEDFNRLVEEGDQANASDQLETALAKYQEAIGVKASPEVDQKIADVQAKIKSAQDQANKKAQYNALISEAETKMGADDLEGAKAKYQEAQGVDPAQTLPGEKIAEIDQLIADRDAKKAKDDAYNGLIAEAEALYGAKNLQGAIDKYKEAIAVDNTQDQPAKRIKEIEDEIAQQAADQEKKEKYDAAIAEANKLFGESKLEDAKGKYEEALAIDAGQSLPQEKIAEIDRLIQEKEEAEAKQQQIASLLQEGNDLLGQKKLEDAKSKFQEVLGIDPSNVEATTQVAAINQELAALKSEAEKEEAFNALKQEGYDLADQQNFVQAQQKLQEALSLKQDTEVEAKLAEIAEAIKDQQAAQAVDDQYNNAIADAEGKENAGSLEAAIAAYQQASSIKPAESLPQDKIKELQDRIAQLKDDQAAQAIEDQYNNAIADAQGKENAGNLEAAIAAYQQASSIKPAESLPQDKIKELQDRIAQLKDDQAAQAIEDQYNNAIADAQGKENAGNLEAAIAAYQQASSIKPAESLPQDKIKELQDRIAQLKDDQAAQAIEDQYNNAIADAQGKENAGNLEAAIAAYETASSIKPGESLPKDKVKELQDRIEELKNQAASQEVDKQYDAVLADAENKENAGNLEAAIAAYQQASSIKPEESLPKDKVKELQNRIANMATNAEELEKNYKEAMGRGDELMAQKSYLDALKEYNKALALKPNEQEPKDKAAEAERLERERDEFSKQYEKILNVAQDKIDKGDYSKAEELISRAMKLKPEDSRPQELLDQIAAMKKAQKNYDEFMSKAEAKATAEKYKDAIALFKKAKKAKPSESLPDERIAAMNEFLNTTKDENREEDLYNGFMAKGQATEGAKKYAEALGHYQNALTAKPGDQTAQDKVSEMQQILDEIANAKADQRAKKSEFDKLIKEADELFAQKKYVPSAKDKYEEALKLFPNDSYALSQRDEAIRLARKESITSEDKEYRKLLKVADKNFDKESYEKAKELYNRAVKFRSNDPYPKSKLAEIEAILNPIVEESVQLEELGDPYDGSILDGGFLLKQAENERKLEKGIQIKSELNKAEIAASEVEAKKAQDRGEVINDIYALQQTIREDSKESDESRLATIDALRKAELERQAVEKQNHTFEKAENLSSQETLNQIEEEVALDYLANSGVHMDNVEILNSFNTAQQKELTARSKHYVDLGMQTDQVLHDISVDIMDEQESDAKQRELAGREVGKSVTYASEVYGEIDNEDYNRNLKQKDGIDKVHEKYQTKFVEGKKATDDNHEEMKVVRTNVDDMTAFRESVESEHRTDVEGEIKEVKLKMIAEQQDFTEEQRISNEKFHQIKVDKSEADLAAYSDEMEKYLENKAILDVEERKRKDIGEKAEKAHSDKVAYVEGVEQKATSNHSQAEMSDEDERLNARAFVENVELSRADDQGEAKEKHDKKIASFKSVNKSVTKQKENGAMKQRDKVLDAQSKLNDVETAPKKKIKTANALGQEYPEGVSQESFTRKDSKGLINAVITRRVVVVEGHADVYVRTQTASGVTYTKNNKPSLQHVWNKETQGPHLERHF